MPTLEERVAALEAQTPRRSYTSMWSGEEIDRRLLNAAGRNLLDNSYWAAKECIINQRNNLLYNVGQNSIYTIDRWILSATGYGNIEIINNGIKLTNISFLTKIAQKLDDYLTSSILGSSVTCSFLVDNNHLLTVTANIPSTVSDGQRIAYKSYRVANVTANLELKVVDAGKRLMASIDTSNAGSMIINSAKLEPGPVSTLAHKDAAGNWVLNDPPPNPTLELLKCQRYQVIETRAMNGIMGRTEADDKNITLFVPVPVCMRANPLVTIPKLTVAGNGKAKSYFNVSKSGSAMPAGINLSTAVPESSGIGAFQAIFCYMPEGYTIDANL